MRKFLLAFMLSLFFAANSAYADQKNPRGSRVNQTSTSSPGQGGVVAVSSDTFLSSLGVNTHVDQGYNPNSYVAPLQYLGIRNIRDGERNLFGYIMLHRKTGIHVDLLANLSRLKTVAKTLSRAGILLSVEGPNEPNNFPVTYNGKRGGGTSESWAPVAQLQKELYSAAKNDRELKQYPIFHVSEGGAETDNVGLQFLVIPAGAGTLFPAGTQYADYANPHNYVSSTSNRYVDNQAWQAADPTLNSHWDGLYGEYGRTWKMHFQGYSDTQLQTLQRVTTETGWDSVANPGGERIQGTVLVNTYLAQFKRGWRYTFIYELGEGEGGGGNQGLFHKDWTPKLSAIYIHNLTSVLADIIPVASPEKLDYSIANEPATVHDLLLQKSSGVFELVVWGEQVAGANDITVNLGGPHAKVKIYDVTSGTKPIRTLTDVSSVPLMVSDHAMIVEIN
jgi:hypothetical protein